jgi:hypothetical protein
VFVDEFHDVLNCHPGRVVPWKNLAHKFGKLRIQIVLMTGTGPPCRIAHLIKPFGMKTNLITEVRSSTNRPEIGMHVVHLQPIAAKQSLGHLVVALCNRLAAEERMLVFCSSQADAEIFALQAQCAVYHSDLWEAGNTKDDNLKRWDEGGTKVMACTTAFAQGMDRPHVRYVVIFKPSYGLIVNNQMLGRAGRDGKESHVFFLSVGKGKAFKGPSTDQCVGELDDLVHGKQCRRLTNMLCMDGDHLALRCTDDPRGIYCDICDPHSVMQQLAIESISCPLKSPVTSAGVKMQVVAAGSSLQAPIHAPQDVTTGTLPALTPLQTEIQASLLDMSIMSCFTHKFNMQASMSTPCQSQSSDAMYNQGTSALTSFEALMFDAMENIHGPVSVSHACIGSGIDAWHVPASNRVYEQSIYGMNLFRCLVDSLTEACRLNRSHVQTAR